MIKLRYYLPDSGETPEYAESVPGCEETNPRRFSIVAADWYHARRGGWEVTWPLTLAIVDDADKELGRYEVDRTMVPEFHVTKSLP